MTRTAFLFALILVVSTRGYTQTPGTATPATDSAPTQTHPLLDAGQSNPYVREIVHDLITAHLLDRFDRLSFALDTAGLSINGVKQDDAIYRPFRTKYIKHPKDHFIYSQHYGPHGGGTHTEVKIDHFGPKLEQ